MFRRKRKLDPEGLVDFRPVDKLYVQGKYELPVPIRDQINDSYNKARDALLRTDFLEQRISDLEKAGPPPADRLKELEDEFDRLAYILRMERGVGFQRRKSNA